MALINSYSATSVMETFIDFVCGEENNNSNPSTLQGRPVGTVVPPGFCQFGSFPIEVPLLQRTQVSPNTYVVRFVCPDQFKPLLLSTCACILVHATRKDSSNGEKVTRPYTPISTNQDVGYFDLLIKHYPDGKMSTYLTQTIQVGDYVAFTHIASNVKIQYEQMKTMDKIGMIVGGSGITPMIQALHALLGNVNSHSSPHVTMLYSNRTVDDILAYDLLSQWARDYPDRFTLMNILSREPETSTWPGLRGRIDRAMIEKYMPAASESNSCIFICGPTPMYEAFTGPREERDTVTGVLGEMGYNPKQVFKF